MKRSNIASAVQQNGGRCNPNLSHKVLATTKIGQLLPIFHQETIPGDTVKLHSSMFCRTLPLSVPSYVNLLYRTMSVFVPYHQVADGVESFMANEQAYRGQGNRIPLITEFYLRGFLGDPHISENNGTSSNYDFCLAGTTGTSDQYFLLTPLGRYAMKVLHLLGYRFGKRIGYFTSSDQGTKYNALPLLAMAHAYNSFMSYSPNQNTSDLSRILEQGKRTANWLLSGQQMVTIFQSLLVTYEDSFFSTCWKAPFNSVANFTATGFKQVANLEKYASNFYSDQTNMEYGANTGVFTSPQLQSGNITTITNSQIRLLLKYDDYFRRSNYSGSKDIEKIYSQLGVKVDDYRTRYPYFLNESTKSVNIGDVTSTADSGDAKVGSYAGKAIGDGDGGFEYHSTDYGMLFTFAWFAPKPMFYLGVDKENLRVDPFDFYTPQLDQNLAVPVQYKQFFAEGNNSALPAVFGYEPLYLEYLYHNDYIVGDFETRADFTPWHFGYRKQLTNTGVAITAQDDGLIYLPNTGTEFERIFMIDNTELLDVDTIYLTIDNDCRASRPMRDMTGKLGLGDGDVDVNINGSEVH